MSARKIERMLAAAGVHEGACPPYLTTARGMFSAIAWKAIHTVPEGADADELIRNAHAFAASFWPVFKGRHTVQTHAIHGRHNAMPTANGTLQPKAGMAFVGGATYLPSVRTAAPARHVVASDMPAVQARADELAPLAIAMLREDLPGVAIRRAYEGRVTRWGGMEIHADIEGNSWQAAAWTSVELLNKDMDDLLHEVGYAAPRVHEAIFRRDALLREDPGIAAALADIAERSMLPIMLTAAPCPDRNPGGQYDATILLHGYGPGGEAGIHRIGGIGARRKLDALSHDIDRRIVTQRRLHEQYGPTPSSSRHRWSIDVVTARMLLEAEGAAEALARTISSGRAQAGGLELRICSRQPHRILGRGAITAAATWHGDEIRILGTTLPDTVMATLPGKPIDAIVDSPLLKDAGTITAVRVDKYRDTPRINIRVKPTMKALNLGRNANDVEL